MNKFKKIIVFLIICGIVAAIFILIVNNHFNTDEFKEAEHISNNFLDLIYHGNYIESVKYVDTSKIKIEDLKKIAILASHYYLDAKFLLQNDSGNFDTGFKAITFDKDKMNDESLEFKIGKVNGQLKITEILSKMSNW